MGSSPDISVSVTESVSIDKVTETDMQSSQTSPLETTPSTMTGENKENEEKDEREPLGGRVIPEGELTFDEDGLPVLTDQELETASKVLQVFYRFPETAVGARFVKYSKEYNLRQNVRINAMRWLKPGNVPSVKTILKTKQTNELEVLHSSGIRLGRNRKKRLLPNQLGQVYIGANEDDEPALLLPPSDNNQLVDASQSTTGETVPIDTASGYNVPVAEATKNFVPFKRKDISDTFRVHPSVDAVPLSSAEKTFNNDMSDEHIIPNVEKISKTTKSSVEVELIEDEAIASESESDAKRVKTGENSVKSIKPSEVLRARHATNYTAENPQPAGETLQPDAEILSPTNVQLLQMESVSGTFSVSKDTRIDPQSASDYLKVDARTGLQSVAETADIAQRYARSFTGSNVPINVNGTTKVAGSPSSNTTEAAFVEEVDENEDVDNTPKSNDFNDGMSRDNKIIKKGKQEQQQWSSKENLYGGSVKVVDENAVKDEKVEESLSAKAQMPEIEVPEGRPRALKNAIPCYVCKRHFKVLHHFYDRLCPTCAEFNYKKRFQTADMVIRRRDPNTRELVVTPRVCLVTGARVKIGYEIAIKLLRAGAFVIATSRFAHDTALRFYKEDDFHEWKDRLHIYALDFRVISAVEMFANYILRMYPRLDMVMNNAAQTIRRPPQFYRHLLQQERIPLEALPECVQPLVQDFLAPEFRKAAVKTSVQLLETFGFSKNAAAITHLANPKLAEDAKTMDDSTTGTDAEKTSTEKTSTEKTDNANSLQVYGDDANTMSTRLVTMLSHPSAIAINPAELTQLALVSGDEDKEEDAEIFPVGLLDKDDQQIDLRDRQTWVLQADEVSTVELAEVQLVNSMAPFILNTKLKPLLKRSGDPTWVINVTSMEGKFRGFKDTTHPHTNMAKAALNMFTHTSSKDFAHDRIFMNAVDTGWVTEELPHAIAVHKANIGFAPPLDENDGASRCLDPVFTSLLTGVYEFGKFFKDYGEGHW